MSRRTPRRILVTVECLVTGDVAGAIEGLSREVSAQFPSLNSHAYGPTASDVRCIGVRLVEELRPVAPRRTRRVDALTPQTAEWECGRLTCRCVLPAGHADACECPRTPHP